MYILLILSNGFLILIPINRDGSAGIWGKTPRMSDLCERLFQLQKNRTDIKTEVVAGFTTFLTMSYVIVVSPSILSTGNGIPFSGALTATIFVAAFSSILMGLVANLPFALAPGMGVTAFFTYGVVMGMGVPWQTALGTVFVSGIIFLFLTIVRVREMIVHAIPECIRYGVASGIGLFLTLIGLKQSCFIVSSPETLVTFGGFTPEVVIFLAGLLFTISLTIKRIKASLLIGIVFTTLLAYLNGRLWAGEILVRVPEEMVSAPDFTSAFFKLDIPGALKLSMIATIFTFFFTDMFDSISTFLGVAQVTDLKDERGEPKNLKQALLIDASSTTMAGLFGSSSGTTYIESVAGIEAGGRSGLAAVTVGILFLPFLYLSPVVEMVPTVATAPAVVLVGSYMIKAITYVDFGRIDEGIPAFLALILIPLTYSITQGISWSFIFYSLIKVLTGKAREVRPMLYLIVAFAILALIFVRLKDL